MSAAGDNHSEFLTVRQVAERLQVSPGAVYRLCADSFLGHIRVGIGRGTIRIGLADLQAYLERCRQESENRAQNRLPAKSTPRSGFVFRPFKHIRLAPAPQEPLH